MIVQPFFMGFLRRLGYNGAEIIEQDALYIGADELCRQAWVG